MEGVRAASTRALREPWLRGLHPCRTGNLPAFQDCKSGAILDEALAARIPRKGYTTFCPARAPRKGAKGETRPAPEWGRYARIAPAALATRGHTNSYKTGCEPGAPGRVCYQVPIGNRKCVIQISSENGALFM